MDEEYDENTGRGIYGNGQDRPDSDAAPGLLSEQRLAEIAAWLAESKTPDEIYYHLFQTTPILLLDATRARARECALLDEVARLRGLLTLNWHGYYCEECGNAVPAACAECTAAGGYLHDLRTNRRGWPPVAGAAVTPWHPPADAETLRVQFVRRGRGVPLPYPLTDAE